MIKALFSGVLIGLVILGIGAGLTQAKDEVAVAPEVAVAAEPQAASLAQPVSRMDALFVALADAKNKQEADAIERLIEHAWLQTGNPEMDNLMARGVIFMNHRKFDQAIQTFNGVIAKMPDNAEAWNQRAAAYFIKGDLQQAWRDVVVAIDLNPRHFRALIGAGLLQQAFGDDAVALANFEAALELHPYLGGVRDRVEALRSIVRGMPI